MIGGGGSTAKRAAAEVIGGGAAELATAAGVAGPGGEAGTALVLDVRGSVGLLDAALDAGLANDGRGGIGRGTPGDGITDPAEPRAPGALWLWEVAIGAGASPRKSLTRVSTSWLIEMLLVSQKAFSRSYVVRLTLMLRRVCFLAMVHSLRYG
jgi:hypothetical protein